MSRKWKFSENFKSLNYYDLWILSPWHNVVTLEHKLQSGLQSDACYHSRDSGRASGKKSIILLVYNIVEVVIIVLLLYKLTWFTRKPLKMIDCPECLQSSDCHYWISYYVIMRVWNIVKRNIRVYTPIHIIIKHLASFLWVIVEVVPPSKL